LRVTELEIQNFRNIAKFKQNFEPAGAIIYGKNGTGKTNLLEAISYCAFGKSIRSAADAELVNFSKAFFRLSGKFTFADKELTITAANDKKQKIIKLDDSKIDRISEMYQYVKVVYFSPEDIELVSGGPIYRRRFIDLAISQTSYQYLEDLRTYHRILKQRNALLKTDFSYKEKRAWDGRLAELASKIICKRLDYLKKFIPSLCKKYFFVSGEEEELSVAYKYSFLRDDTLKMEDNISEHLERIEADEIRLQRTLVGPHLDDIDFLIKSRSARSYGSQGQKRSLAITSRLVQADIIRSIDAEAPILIFDDVLADLDRNRAKRIMEILERDHQIFIATPNLELYKNFGLKAIDLEQRLNEQ